MEQRKLTINSTHLITTHKWITIFPFPALRSSVDCKERGVLFSIFTAMAAIVVKGKGAGGTKSKGLPYHIIFRHRFNWSRENLFFVSSKISIFFSGGILENVTLPPVVFSIRKLLDVEGPGSVAFCYNYKENQLIWCQLTYTVLWLQLLKYE